jgi:hypothetical protein
LRGIDQIYRSGEGRDAAQVVGDGDGVTAREEVSNIFGASSGRPGKGVGWRSSFHGQVDGTVGVGSVLGVGSDKQVEAGRQAPDLTPLVAVVGGEVKLVVEDRQVGRVGTETSAPDVGIDLECFRGCVVFPKLCPKFICGGMKIQFVVEDRQVEREKILYCPGSGLRPARWYPEQDRSTRVRGLLPDN